MAMVARQRNGFKSTQIARIADVEWKKYNNRITNHEKLGRNDFLHRLVVFSNNDVAYKPPSEAGKIRKNKQHHRLLTNHGAETCNVATFSRIR